MKRKGRKLPKADLGNLDAAPGERLVEGVERQGLGGIRLAGSMTNSADGDCR